MKLRVAAAGLAGALVCAAPAAVWAHFNLLAPASWLQENPLGDPQKMAPCGGQTGKESIPTGVVTPVTGGALLHLKVKETVYHPGHYRVALAVLDRSELPADPEDSVRQGPKGPLSVAAKVDPRPRPPVLLDGLWDHHDRQVDRIWETDVKIPNINCDHCTLQVIQFMEEHGLNADGRFSYHHCGDLKVTANPLLPIDTKWPGQKKAAKGKAKAKPKG